MKVKGFSMLEILVAIAIIGALATIVVISTAPARQRQTDVQTVKKVSTIKQALESFYFDNGRYPNETEFAPGQALKGPNGKIYLDIIPEPTEVKNSAECAGAAKDYSYEISPTTFTIKYCVVSDPGPVNQAVKQGINDATPDYVIGKKDACEANTTTQEGCAQGGAICAGAHKTCTNGIWSLCSVESNAANCGCEGTATDFFYRDGALDNSDHALQNANWTATNTPGAICTWSNTDGCAWIASGSCNLDTCLQTEYNTGTKQYFDPTPLCPDNNTTNVVTRYRQVVCDNYDYYQDRDNDGWGFGSPINTTTCARDHNPALSTYRLNNQDCEDLNKSTAAVCNDPNTPFDTAWCQDYNVFPGVQCCQGPTNTINYRADISRDVATGSPKPSGGAACRARAQDCTAGGPTKTIADCNCDKADTCDGVTPFCVDTIAATTFNVNNDRLDNSTTTCMYCSGVNKDPQIQSLGQDRFDQCAKTPGTSLDGNGAGRCNTGSCSGVGKNGVSNDSACGREPLDTICGKSGNGWEDRSGGYTDAAGWHTFNPYCNRQMTVEKCDSVSYDCPSIDKATTTYLTATSGQVWFNNNFTDFINTSTNLTTICAADCVNGEGAYSGDNNSGGIDKGDFCDNSNVMRYLHTCTTAEAGQDFSKCTNKAKNKICTVGDCENATSANWYCNRWEAQCKKQPCGGYSNTWYNGVNYSLINAGDQCWLNVNLNSGATTTDQNMDNDTTWEKNCYDNSNANCGNDFGGLYQWTEAVGASHYCRDTDTWQWWCDLGYGSLKVDKANYLPTGLDRLAGPCSIFAMPTGQAGFSPFKIPTVADWYALANYYRDTSTAPCDKGNNCPGAGLALLSNGFNAKLGGLRNPDGTFDGLDNAGYYWATDQHITSTENVTDARAYLIRIASTTGSNDFSTKRMPAATGASIRCLFIGFDTAAAEQDYYAAGKPLAVTYPDATTSSTQNIYGVVAIYPNNPSRVWLDRNLDIGKVISTSTSQSAGNTVIEKYCYGGTDDLQCAKRGGFYIWSEAMRGMTNETSRGLCPSGSHIPTEAEWSALERDLYNQYNASDSNCADGGSSCSGNRFLGWNCSCAGKLKQYSDNPPDSGINGCTISSNCDSNFRGILGGFVYGTYPNRRFVTSTLNEGNYGLFWTSTEVTRNGTNAYYRALGERTNRIERGSMSKYYAMPIRCIANY